MVLRHISEPTPWIVEDSRSFVEGYISTDFDLSICSCWYANNKFKVRDPVSLLEGKMYFIDSDVEVSYVDSSDLQPDAQSFAHRTRHSRVQKYISRGFQLMYWFTSSGQYLFDGGNHPSFLSFPQGAIIPCPTVGNSIALPP